MSTADQMSDPKDGLSDILESHAKTNAKLLLRVAELEAESGRWEAMSRSTQDHRLEVETERDALREQVATLQQRLGTTLVERDDARRRYYLSDMNLDAAKADAARLREAYRAQERARDAIDPDELRVKEISLQHARYSRASTAFNDALAATDSVAWLESKIAERTAQHEARYESLQQQLVAATNDAARAELRARDLDAAITIALNKLDVVDDERADSVRRRAALGTLRETIAVAKGIAASPDSDGRLREVIRRALNIANGVGQDTIDEDTESVIDEVLRGGA